TNVYTADGRVVHIATAVASARGASAPAGPPGAHDFNAHAGYEGTDALHKPSLQGPGPVTDADPEGHTANQTPSTTLTTMPQLPADLAQAAMARASQAAVNAVTARAAEDSARAAWQAAQLQSHATPVGERFAYHPVAVASDIQLLPASASGTAGQPHAQESHAAAAREGAQGGGHDGSDGSLLAQTQAAGAADVAGGPDLGSYRAVPGVAGMTGGSAYSPGHRGGSREEVRLLGGGVAPHPAELVSHVRMLGQRD
ncbi:hypothetical protein QJQ45_027025, partial [Haematococcus lacustris]